MPFDFMFRRHERKSRNRRVLAALGEYQEDLFGEPPRDPGQTNTRVLNIARDLRSLSETAIASGYDRSACLIELAALVLEMEDERGDQGR